MRTLSSQLAQIIEDVNLLTHIHDKNEQKEFKSLGLTGVSFLRGKASTSGIAFGRAAVMDDGGIDEFLDSSLDDLCGCTSESFHKALKITEAQLEKLQIDMAEQFGDVAALIFSAHLLILKDSEFSGAIEPVSYNTSDAADDMAGV